ncbi:MAG: hypothetical protein IT176_13240 [Acidobacteria bacterium]|nr:hypothetical protein [Acidobacteriota bacterium]
MMNVTSPRAKHVWTALAPARTERQAERRAVRLPGRLTWKDHRGTTRFASVVTCNVSELGVYVECQASVAIPLYRLVQFQLESDARHTGDLPAALRQGRQLSAVYRISPPSAPGEPQGLALRLLVDPKRAAAVPVRVRATA